QVAPVWIAAIRRLMASKDWSQRDLSDASGIRPNTISDILNDDNPTSPRVETMAQLARGLGVPLWALFCEEREYSLFVEQVKQISEADQKTAREQELRAAVQA